MKKRTFIKSLALPLAFPVKSGFAQIAGAPMRMVLPLPAGSFSDFVARLICRSASQILGQPIVIYNKPGANGVIGVMEVVRSAPDGLTLLCGSNSNLAANMAMVKNIPYDPRRDLTCISGANSVAQMLVVKSDSQIRSIADFVAYAKKRPGKLSVGYATSIVQLQFAALGKMTEIDLLPVPYKGAPTAVNDIIGGILDATLDAPSSSLPQVQAGKLLAIASTTKRNVLFPDVPAVSETVQGFDFPLWNAFMGPAALPQELVQRISSAFIQAQRQPEVMQQLLNAGAPALILKPEQLKKLIEDEVSKYKLIAKQTGIQAQ